MADREFSVPPAEVRAAQKLFEDWREQKRGRDRIPDRLWRVAARLCARESVHRVARWLRLNDTALRDRVQSARSKRGGRRPNKPARRSARSGLRTGPRETAPAFVEWVSTGPTPVTAEYVLELDDGLRIRVCGAGVDEIAALAKLVREECACPAGEGRRA